MRSPRPLGYLFNGGPGPEPPKDEDPDGPWVDDEKRSGVPLPKEMAILDAADPPVRYDYGAGEGLIYDITGHPQEDDLGIKLGGRLGIGGWPWR